MAKINIRESLSKRDLISDNKYDLRNTYDSLNLSNKQKARIAEALYNNKPNKYIYSLLNNKLNENMFIDEFSRYSEEYEKLDRVSTFLTAMSPNKYYYYVGNTYFDFGQDWKWTTILAKTPRGDSYQALNPRQQEDILLATSDEELEEIAKQILKNSYVDKGFMQEGFSTRNVAKSKSKYINEDNEEIGTIEKEALKEAFDADRVQKRIACTTEFDNGHVFHNDYFRASSAEAEEMARQKSIENPGKVFYVKYDNVMEPCSDIKWKNGKKINESKSTDLEDDIYDDNGVEEGDRFFADGKDYTWEERIAGPIHLDFDNWAVWSARESVNIFDYATEKPGGGYDVDKDAYIKAYIESPIKYFVVDEDTGFIDWGPCDTDIEAKDFLNSKQDDWENDTN